MDFQKMVRQFRENVLEESEPPQRPQLRQPQPINEMASADYRAAAEERVVNLEDGTADTPLAWGSLFPEAAEGTNNPAPDGRATRMILDFIPNEMKMAIEIGKKLTKLGWTPDFSEKEVTKKRTVRNAQGEEERVATREAVLAMGEAWGPRMLGFGMSYITFPILAWYFMNETPFSPTTLLCIMLSFCIISIHLFWKTS